MRNGIITLSLFSLLFVVATFFTISSLQYISTNQIPLECVHGLDQSFNHPKTGELYTLNSDYICKFSKEGDLLEQKEIGYQSLPFHLFYGNSWSPDYSVFVVWTSDHRILKINSETLTIDLSIEIQDIIDGEININGNIILSSGSNLIFYHNNTVWEFDPLGDLTELYDLPTDELTINYGLLSHDLKHIALYLSSGIRIYNLETLSFTDFSPSSVYFPENSDNVVIQNYIEDTTTIAIFDLLNQVERKRIVFTGFIDEPKFFENNMLILQTHSKETNQFESSKRVRIYDIASNKLIYDQWYRKGPGYEISVTSYSLHTKLVFMIDYNGHNEPQLIVLDTSNNNASNDFEFSLLLLGISSTLLIISAYFYLRPKHFHFLLNPHKSDLSFIVSPKKDLSEEELSKLRRSIGDLDWINKLFLLLIGILSIGLFLDYPPFIDEVNEDLAYNTVRTIIHAVFSFMDIGIIGILTLTYIILNKNRIPRWTLILIMIGFIIFSILTVLLRYYQGYSFGNQTPYHHLSETLFLGILRLYLIIQVWILKFEDNPPHMFHELLPKKIVVVILTIFDVIFIIGTSS